MGGVGEAAGLLDQLDQLCAGARVEQVVMQLATSETAELAGLWVTSYLVDNRHHVDLSAVSATRDGVSVNDYRPSPRLEGQERGYANDRYFYGALHLAVLPGEMTMDGLYTAVLTDT